MRILGRGGEAGRILVNIGWLGYPYSRGRVKGAEPQLIFIFQENHAAINLSEWKYALPSVRYFPVHQRITPSSTQRLTVAQCFPGIGSFQIPVQYNA